MMKHKEEEMNKIKKESELRERQKREEDEKALLMASKSKAVSNPATIRRRMANAHAHHAQFSTLRNLYNSKNQAGTKQIASNAHRNFKREVTVASDSSKAIRTDNIIEKFKKSDKIDPKALKPSSK